jgi:quinol monooxygenase YgiN
MGCRGICNRKTVQGLQGSRVEDEGLDGVPPLTAFDNAPTSCYKLYLIDIYEGGIGMVTLIARLPITEGKMDEALEAFKELVPKVAAEEGTVLYSLNVEKANPNTLVVVEQYRDKESLKLHSSTPYLKEFFEKSASFTSGKTEIVIMEEISRA